MTKLKRVTVLTALTLAVLTGALATAQAQQPQRRSYRSYSYQTMEGVVRVPRSTKWRVNYQADRKATSHYGAAN